ncbi:MAG: T9SS type A sorting domain-containing protein [Bacteroidota bacterium]
MKNKLLHIIILLFFILLSEVSIATDYYISTTGLTGNTGLTAGSPKGTFAQVFTAFNLGSGDIIHVAAGTYTEKGITVGSDDEGFSIVGAGIATTIFSSDQTDRWMLFNNTNNDNITIQDLTVKDYKAASGGGIYLISGCNNISFTNIKFNNCDANVNSYDYGGAVYFAGNTATITNCTFTGCDAASMGGGIAANGSASNLTIDKCVFYSNTAIYGSGIEILAASCTLNLKNSLFYKNTVTNIGTVDIEALATVSIYNCTITGNVSSGGSAAGFAAWSSGTYNIDNTISYNNTSKDFYENSTTINLINCSYGSASTITVTGSKTSCVTGDPSFTNSSADDYTISACSNCKGAGTAAGAPATDLAGTARPNPPSIGCYEASNTSTSYVWNGGTSGAWTTSSNWTPNGVPGSSCLDQVTFNTGQTITVTAVPTSTVASLTVNTNTNVMLRNTVSSTTLSVGDGSGADLSVTSGSTLILDYNTSNSASMTLVSGSTGSIAGTLAVNGTGTNTGATYTSTGTTTISGTYNHARDGGTIPTATWSSGATCDIQGMTNNAPSDLTQTFHHLKFSTSTLATKVPLGAITTNGDLTISLTFSGSNNLCITNSASAYTWNIGGNLNYTSSAGTFNFACASVSGTGSPNNTVNVTGNFAMTGGASLDFINTGGTETGTTQTLNVGGNFTHSAGTITTSKVQTCVINFNGTSTQIIESTGQTNAITFKTTQTGASAKVLVNDAKTFTLGSSSTFTVQNNASNNTELEIGTGTTGIFNNTNATAGSLTVNASALVKVFAGAQLKTYSTITNNGSFTIDGTYEHLVNGGTIPTATWAASSTCLITGVAGSNAVSGIGGQTFGNFTWNWTSLTSTANVSLAVTGNVVVQGNLTWTGHASGYYVAFWGAGNHTLDIYGDLIVNSANSNLRFQNSAGAGGETNIINLKGNFNHSAGIINYVNSSSFLAFNFNGTSQQTFTSTGTLTNTHTNWTVNSGATLLLASDLPVAASRTATITGTLICGTGAAQKNVTGGGSFVLSNASTATLKITNSTDGITSAVGTATGNIRTTTARTFNTGANYYYMGNAAQISGTGLPATVNNLTIDNTSGVTLTSAVTVAGILALTNGILTSGTTPLVYVSNTSTSAITGASSSNYVDGPLKWLMSNTFGDTYIFPIGKGGSYYPFTISSHTSTSQAPTVEVFNSGSGGSGMLLSSTEYWKVIYSAGAMSAGIVKLERPTAITGYSVVGRCATGATGSYSTLGGSISGNSITSTSSVGTVTGNTEYYAMAAPCPSYSGTITVGPTGTFTDLTQAIINLTNCGYTGNIVLELQSNYSCASETFPITFASTIGSSAAKTITVRPATGANGLSITSSNTTGTLLFNGADYIYFDGSPGALRTMSNANNLSIINTYNTSSAAYAVKYVGDATYNKLEYCNVRSNASTATSGTIWFSTGSSTGNEFNEVNYCEIYKETATPTNAIYALGDATVNNNITIDHNYIYDFFSASFASNGMLLSDYNTDWSITNNKFYQTATRTQTSSVQHSAVFITYTLSAGSSFLVNGNTIGYSASNSTGTYTFVGNSSAGSRFIPIYLKVGTTASTVKSNTITNITISVATNSVNQALPGTFAGIAVLAGAVNIGATGEPNTIGSTSGTGAITYYSGTSGNYWYGIYSNSTSTVDISYNNIGGIATHASTGATINYLFYGIYTHSTNSGATTISYNNIGSSTQSNSISIGVNGTTTSGVCSLYGIYNRSTGTATITYNAIENLTVYGTGASKIYGISNEASAATSSISNNTLSTFATQSTGTSVSATITAILNIAAATIGISNNSITSMTLHNGYFTGIIDNAAASGTHTISSNTIGSASADNISISTAAAGTHYGIYIQSTGTYSITNNTIQNITSSGNPGAALSMYGINCLSTGAYTVTSNTIKNIKITSTADWSNIVCGIYFAYSGGYANSSTTCNKNRIVNLVNAATRGSNFPSIYGISYNGYGSGTHPLTNNFVLIDNESNTNSVTIVGINPGVHGTGPTVYMYYNTVVIGGSDVGAGNTAIWAYCTDVSGTYAALYVKNNIFKNTRTSTNNSARTTIVKYNSTSNYYNSPSYAAPFVSNYGWATNASYYTTTNGGTNTTANAWRGLSICSGETNNDNSSTITINTDASLSTADLVTVYTAADVHTVVTDDINGTIALRNTTPYTNTHRGCYEGPIQYYWVGGSGNWSNYTTHWSNSSGGAPNASTVPTSADDVHFDASSGGGTATIDATAYCNNFIGTGYAGILAIGANTINVSGYATMPHTCTISTGILNVDGNFDATGGTITASGAAAINLAGSTITSLGTFNYSTSTVTLDGSAQSFPASTVYNLTSAGSGTKTLAGAVNVRNILNFSADTKIATGANTLTIGVSGSANGSITGQSSVRYIIAYDNAGTIGSLKRYITSNSTYIYPIGDATHYTPLTFKLNSNAGLSSADLTVYTKAEKVTGLNGSITNYIDRFWRYTQTGMTTPNYDLTLIYDASDIHAGTDASKLLPIKRSGSTWYVPTSSTLLTGVTVEGTSTGTDFTTNTLKWNGLSTFSDAGGAGDQSASLPVSLLSFNAECNEYTAELEWKTASELNNNFFSVERSYDMQQWVTIGNVNSKGNSNSIQSYQLSDNTVDFNYQTIFYRLSQTDFDGQFEVFNPIALSCKDKELFEIISVDKDGSSLSIIYNGVIDESISIMLYTVAGQQIFNKNIISKKGTNKYYIRDIDFKPGVYMLMLETSDKVLSKKLLIKE